MLVIYTEAKATPLGFLRLVNELERPDAIIPSTMTFRSKQLDAVVYVTTGQKVQKIGNIVMGKK